MQYCVLSMCFFSSVSGVLKVADSSEGRAVPNGECGYFAVLGRLFPIQRLFSIGSIFVEKGEKKCWVDTNGCRRCFDWMPCAQRGIDILSFLCSTKILKKHSQMILCILF